MRGAARCTISKPVLTNNQSKTNLCLTSLRRPRPQSSRWSRQMKWKEAPHFPERHKLQSKSAWLSGLACGAMILPDIRYCPPCWASGTDEFCEISPGQTDCRDEDVWTTSTGFPARRFSASGGRWQTSLRPAQSVCGRKLEGKL